MELKNTPTESSEVMLDPWKKDMSLIWYLNYSEEYGEPLCCYFSKIHSDQEWWYLFGSNERFKIR